MSIKNRLNMNSIKFIKIKKIMKVLGKWYNNQNFFRKAIILYLFCAAVPMILVTFYNYSQTRAMLVEQAYADMRRNMNTMKSGVSSMLQPYETVARTLQSDKALNILLNYDYTGQTYGDLVYYCRTTLDNLLALYPSVNWLRFYSGNESLPENNSYFYRLDRLSDEAAMLADSRRGRPVASGSALTDSGDNIILLSRINYYASALSRNYIVLNIQRDAVSEQLYQEREGWKVYLLDGQGGILAASGGTDTDGDVLDRLNVRRVWEILLPGRIETNLDKTGLMYLRTELDMGMTIIMTVDRALLLRETNAIPQRALAGFLLLTLLALAAAFAHSRVQAGRLNSIVEATGKIGGGQFDCVLEDMGRDEFGQIATAVNQMNGQINALIQENYERQLRIKTSEMNLLQEQINPHFLYNALGTISFIALREGGKQTVRSVRCLADFYRLSLNRGRQAVTVGEEIELLRSYMNIQMLRFPDTLEIRYAVDPAVAEWRTIKLILQPLVENAIQHGQREEQVLHIAVRAGRSDGRLFYEVEDDGAGIEPDKLETLRTELTSTKEGFGLKNVDIRIKLHYGNEFGVQIFSVPGEGTKIHVELPGGG